jgi:hypothetical protein
MTTEADQANPNPDSQDDQPQDETTEERATRLETELADSEQKRKSAEGRLRNRDEQYDVMRDMEGDMHGNTVKTVERMLDAGLEGNEEARIRVREIATEEGQRTERESQMRSRKSQIEEILDTNQDLDWDKPSGTLAEAKAKWDDGDIDGAHTLVVTANAQGKGGIARNDVQQMIDDAVQNDRIGRASSTRPSQTTVVSAGDLETPRNQAELTQYIRSRRSAGDPVGQKERTQLIRGIRG